MSLINDALKRATSKQITTIPIPPEPAPPMQPVEQPPPRRGLPWYFFPALLAIMAAACWFIVKGVQARQQAGDPAAAPSTIPVKARAPETQTPVATETTAPVVETSPTTPTTPTKASSIPTTPPTPSNTAPTSNTSTETPPPATEAPTPTPPAPTESPKPSFKLQGVFFKPGNPSAMVNGKSVWVGSRVDGATVKTITQDAVTIEANGQTTVLTLN